ncbi:MAG: hypothetical protein IJC99_02900 [Clostridia bacterium]|nr:hypothetical protein [Clostridia bacterium]
MKEKQFSSKGMKYWAFGVSGLALFFFILACVAKVPFYAVLFGIMAGVALAVSCVMLYLVHKNTTGETNYFLFDRRKKICLSERDLTFPYIDDTLAHYVSDFAENALALWKGIPEALEMDLTARPAFRTPVALKMMYDLSEQPADRITEIFSTADKATVAFVCRAVKAGGDKEMADIIFEMKCAPERLGTRVVPFFTKNRRPFEARIYRYVRDHLREFDAYH